MIVHVQTVIQTTFGFVDEEGNIIPQKPLKLVAHVLSADMFAQVYQALMQAKAQIQTESEKTALSEIIRPDYSTSGS